MPASVNDKFRLASGSTRPSVTSLSLPKANGATTAQLTAATGCNTTTGLDYVMYRRELNTTTGKYEEITGTRIEGRATLTGTTLSNMTIDAGTEPASGYAADGNTVVLCAPTAQWADDLVNALLSSHDQTGALLPAAVQTALGTGNLGSTGFNALGYTPNTVTYNGQHSYTCVFNGVDLTTVLSAGMRLRFDRTVNAQTQVTSLNGTSQYWVKTSPNKLTFTNNFTLAVHLEQTSYVSAGGLIARQDGTNGWDMYVNSAGQIIVRAFNGGATNFFQLTSYQSVSLSKALHIAAQVDMTVTTNTPTTNYIMIDGVDIPLVATRGGTNPTALVQGTSALNIGATNGSSFNPCKIAQAAIFSAKVPQATMRGYISQGLTGSESNLVSAWSFNGVATDLNTTTPNDLTAVSSAGYATDSPFSDGVNASKGYDFGLVNADPVYSGGNTTVVVQTAEANAIPTSGGITSVAYSSQDVPFGFPKAKDKWQILYLDNGANTSVNATSWQNTNGLYFDTPIGSWKLAYEFDVLLNGGNSSGGLGQVTLSTSTTSASNRRLTGIVRGYTSDQKGGTVVRSDDITNTTSTRFYILLRSNNSAYDVRRINETDNIQVITAENAYL